MKELLLLITAALFCLAQPAFAGSEVVVLQSSRLLPYEQARQGVERVLAGRIAPGGAKSIHPADLSLFVLSEEGDPRFLKRAIETRRPELLVAIGGTALAFAGDLDTTLPIIFLLVPNPESILHGRGNATGVQMTIPPARQLEGLTTILPAAKRIGTLYDPLKSASLIDEAQAGAAKLGIDLRAEKTRSSKQVPELLAGLHGKIDVFWILPDLTVVTPQTLEKILLFSLVEKIPVLSFSEKHLGTGAAVAITFDLIGMGEAGGRLAQDILRGGNADDLPPVMAEQIKINVNRKVLRKLGSDYNPKAVTAVRPEEKSR